MKIHLILFILIFLSCQKQAKDTTIEIDVKPIIEQKSKIIKPTPETLENFLYDFGDLNQENQAVIETNFGNITLELFNDVYLHRANFIYLVKQGYYNDMQFHRVIKNFIIQGGRNRLYETTKRRANIGYQELPNEIITGYKHTRGMISAAREWENNPKKKSSAFEFFIVQSHQGAPHLNGEHTVFGRVIDGMDVIDAISRVKTAANDWPIEDVVIKRITFK
jgi:peptidylprolyl isomerase